MKLKSYTFDNSHCKDINKICICFYGLTRSLKRTYPYFKKFLFDILDENNIVYDIYIHTYSLDILTNKRSNEHGVKLDNEEYKMLNIKESIIENQNDFDESFDYSKVIKYGDSWKDDFNSLKNLIRQLNSLKQVTSLIKNREEYDNYLYIRPDLQFVEKIDINFLKYKQSSPYLLTPDFGKGPDKKGLNDRFAIGDYFSIIKYGERIDLIYDYMQNHGKLHSERLVKYLHINNNIFNIIIDIMLLRVRSSGHIARNDIRDLKRYCNTHKKKYCINKYIIIN
tara:strand:+ start:6868 stop:7710 length:843 start_codon:yes stop_codon:yes gene_type:complete